MTIDIERNIEDLAYTDPFYLLENYDNANIPFIEHSSSEQYLRISILGNIEALVRDAKKSKSNAFYIRSKAIDDIKHLELDKKYLSRYYPLINTLLQAFDTKYIYSPEVDLFYQACRNIGLIEIEGEQWQAFTFDIEPLKMDSILIIHHAEQFNRLIAEIRNLLESKFYQAKIALHRRYEAKRLKQACIWERKLFRWRSRHLMLHITLKYKPQYCLDMTISDIRQDFARLLRNKRHNELLSGIKHYVWRIEEGGKTGLHIHWLIAYDGSHRTGMFYAKGICNYWDNEVTQGRGNAYAGNFYKGSLRRIGLPDATGQIDRYNPVKRDALLQVLRYMSKTTQLVKGRIESRCRTFGMTHPNGIASDDELSAIDCWVDSIMVDMV